MESADVWKALNRTEGVLIVSDDVVTFLAHVLSLHYKAYFTLIKLAILSLNFVMELRAENLVLT